MKVEKYLTPAQLKKLEEQQKLEEERRLREKGDNARERALEMMMGGVLEIRKEDELKKVFCEESLLPVVHKQNSLHLFGIYLNSEADMHPLFLNSV